ncbi:hypothetical protein BDW62DRAFT_216053 [Aspergillus aurantiobrunneus]
MSAALVLVLLGLSVFYCCLFYCCFYLTDANGTNALVADLIAAGKLPDSHVPLRTVYTGIAPLDEILTSLVVFLWPVTDGNSPGLALHTISFVGSVNATWALLVLEGYRKGNARTIVAFPVLFALLGQFLTFAFATSIYVALHLLTISTASSPTRTSLLVPKAVLHTLPVVTIIGFLIPAAILLAPACSASTQLVLAAWQLWPACASAVIFLAHTLFTHSSTSNAEDGIDISSPSRTYIRSLRLVYAVTFLTTALPHFNSWTLPFLSYFASAVLGPNTALGPVNLLEIHSLPIPVQTLAEGVHSFIAWDYLIASLAILVWAGSLHRGVYGCLGGAKGAALFALTALVGPVAAAVVALWEREEVVFAAKRVMSMSMSLRKTRRRGGSGMGKWERGGKVLVSADW